MEGDEVPDSISVASGTWECCTRVENDEVPDVASGSCKCCVEVESDDAAEGMSVLNQPTTVSN